MSAPSPAKQTKAVPPPILDAALKVIVKGGVDAVRYRNVADEAGVSLGTVSYYFSAREELIRAALTHYLDEAVRETLALRDRYRDPRASDVADYAVALVRRNLEDSRKWVRAEYELRVYAARDRKVAEALARYEDALVGEMARALEAMGVGSPFAAARTIADLIRGFEIGSLGSRNPDYKDFGKRVSLALQGFQTRSPPKRKRGTHASPSP